MTTSFDIIIIGSGPGGYVAAIRAAQLGMRVAVVEREKQPGGICLHWGCIPTKSLLQSASYYRGLRHAASFGVKMSGSVDLPTVIKRSRDIVDQFAKGVDGLLKKNGVTLFRGKSGKLTERKGKTWAVFAGDSEITAQNVVLATGARARAFPNLKPHPRIWTYREALVPKTLPKSLAVVGGGVIGMELADFYSTLGVAVQIFEPKRILATEDVDVSALAKKLFAAKGVAIHEGTGIRAMQPSKTGVTLVTEKKEEVRVDQVLVSIGIVGNVENIGLEGTKISVQNTHMTTDGFGATAEEGIWAIGDVAGPPWLAHKASHEGVICVEKIAGKNPEPLDASNIPSCIYTTPQIASVGLTEEIARQKYPVKVGVFPLRANGKAVIIGEPEGFVKTIFHAETGALLGGHIIGPEATEMIQGFVIGRVLETTEAELFATIFPHPTVSESMGQSALAAFGRVIDA